MSTDLYIVKGGIYTNGDCLLLEPGTEPETYGPFSSLEEAMRVWQEQTRRNIDICWHKLFIEKISG